MHNVTSVYSSQPDVTSNNGDGEDYNGTDEAQFSEYSMDDVEQGPIHGGRGREKELWAAYNTVNRKFAEVVVQCFNEGDLVWVRDQQHKRPLAIGWAVQDGSSLIKELKGKNNVILSKHLPGATFRLW